MIRSITQRLRPQSPMAFSRWVSRIGRKGPALCAIALAAVIGLGLAGCPTEGSGGGGGGGPGPGGDTSPLVGTWNDSTGLNDLVFNAGGTWAVVSPGGEEPTYSGTYSGTNLTLTYGEETFPGTAVVSGDGNTLTLNFTGDMGTVLNGDYTKEGDPVAKDDLTGEWRSGDYPRLTLNADNSWSYSSTAATSEAGQGWSVSGSTLTLNRSSGGKYISTVALSANKETLTISRSAAGTPLNGDYTKQTTTTPGGDSVTKADLTGVWKSASATLTLNADDSWSRVVEGVGSASGPTTWSVNGNKLVFNATSWTNEYTFILSADKQTLTLNARGGQYNGDYTKQP